MSKKHAVLLMIQLSDRSLEIADNRDNLTFGDLQNAIDAVIMAAYQEGKNATIQHLEAVRR
jgi:hypothetical protein